MIDRAITLALVLFGITACADQTFDHLEYRDVSDAPGPVHLRPTSIEIQEGLAVRARVTAIGNDGDPMDLLYLQSEDPEVFAVDPGPEPGQWVFSGVKVGKASMDVETDHKHVVTISVDVTAP